MARIGTSNVDGESPLLNAANLHLCLYRVQKQIHGMLHFEPLVSFVLHACSRKCWSSQPDILIYICCCYGDCAVPPTISHLHFQHTHSIQCFYIYYNVDRPPQQGHANRWANGQVSLHHPQATGPEVGKYPFPNENKNITVLTKGQD